MRDLMMSITGYALSCCYICYYYITWIFAPAVHLDEQISYFVLAQLQAVYLAMQWHMTNSMVLVKNLSCQRKSQIGFPGPIAIFILCLVEDQAVIKI
jgi:hypothetical protein